jgi:hypothetical protein
VEHPLHYERWLASHDIICSVSNADTPGNPEDSPRRADAPEARRLPRPVTRLTPALTAAPSADAKTLCERCGAEMYRMHAVWRCPACGFKTDCCGW